MACTDPIRATVPFKNRDGKLNIQIVPEEHVKIKEIPNLQEIKLPCGKCDGCRLNRSKEWAVRAYHESLEHSENCFITLTFNEEHFKGVHRFQNPYRSLVKKDFQTFIKRLRKFLDTHYWDEHKQRYVKCLIPFQELCPKKYTGINPTIFRYMHCGEYGTKVGRPHHHAIIFGWRPPDLKFKKYTKKSKIYTSKTIYDRWLSELTGKSLGFHSVGELTYKSCAYVARYNLKKHNAHQYHPNRIPEYITMSRNPGIGHNWAKRNLNNLYVTDVIRLNGFPMKPPRYYDKLLKAVDPEKFDKIKEKRLKSAINNELSESQLKVKREINDRTVRKLKRGIDEHLQTES